MKKLKRFLSCLVALVLVLCLVQIPEKTKAEAISNGDNKTYVKVYYTREDGNYTGWNLWVWVDGANGNVEPGHAEQFDGVDSKGAYKVIARDANSGKLGIIVRTDSWDKCYDGDVTYDLSKGDTELDFTQATKSYEEVAPKTSFDNVTVKLHYYRFDETYTDWDVWGFVGAGAAYQFTDDADGFGKVTTMSFDNVTDADNVGCIVRKNDWSSREQTYLSDGNRFIDKTCINADGQVDVYVVQGDKNTYFTKDQADIAKQPKILTSRIDTLKTVSFTTTFENADNIKDNMTVYSKDGDTKTPVSIESVALSADKKGGTITLGEDLDFANKTYYVDIVNSYGNTITGLLTLGDIYNSQDFADLYTYNGDLGAMYTGASTKFVLWAPTATNVQLKIYGTEGSDLSTAAKETLQMVKGENGTWTYTLDGDQNGVYYNYLVDVDGSQNEVVDPYAKAVGVNGQRAMVLNLDTTDPEGWNAEARPTLANTTDAVIYEMHIRDFTIGDDSGATLEYRGKFKGAWQSGTTIPGTDIATGIDHLKDLGVNTVQIMPAYDYNSVDESSTAPQFNWGYDPQNYSSVEGSYSSNPYDASIRIKEFKELIHALHAAGIRVTMDVVYNHTALSNTSNLNLAVPNYYYRQNESGSFTNGSGCGNELASDRSMVSKLIVDSVVYWAKEFHMDGFRFDLMAVLDKDTMLNVRNELNKIDPKITIIGEGWTGGTSALAPEKQSLKANMGTNFGESQIAAFSDDIRDGIRGNVFSETENGFISGNAKYKDDVKFGIMAATQTVGAKTAWANEPYQCVNYASCHDNWTLYDRLKSTNPDATEDEVLALDKLSASLVYTSQGIPFMLSGEEFARTKENADGSLNENSYNSPDSVNAIGWSRLKDSKYNNLYQYYKGLIAMRGAHKAFKMDTAKQIADNLAFVDVDDSNIIAYTLNGASVNDSWSKIAVIVNANKEEKKVTLPSSDWVVVVNGDKAGVKSLDTVSGNEVTVPAQTSYVLVDKASFDAPSTDDNNNNNNNNNNSGNNNNNNNSGNTNNGSNSSVTNPSNSTSNSAAKVKATATVSTAKKTGDNNNVAMLIVIAVAALAVVGVSVYSVVNKKKVRK